MFADIDLLISNYHIFSGNTFSPPPYKQIENICMIPQINHLIGEQIGLFIIFDVGGDSINVVYLVSGLSNTQ